MACACLSPQWSFHAGAVLSLLQYLPETGAPFREGIDRTTGGGRKRCNCRLSTAAERRAEFPARGSTGRSESRTSATGEKLTGASSCGGFSRLILSWNIRG